MLTTMTDTLKLQCRGFDNAELSGTPWYSPEPEFMVDDLSKDLEVSISAPFSASQDVEVTIQFDKSALDGVAVFDGNADGTADDIGDFAIMGSPDVTFNGFPSVGDDPITDGIVNTVAYSDGATLFSSLTIPAGTSLALDLSIFGTNYASETYGATSKVGFKANLKDQAACTILVTANTNDGGFGKYNSVVSGDADVTGVTYVDNGLTVGDFGSVAFDGASYDGILADATATVTVEDADLTAAPDVVISGGTADFTVTTTEDSPGVYSGTFTVGSVSTGTADVQASANVTLTASYTDADPAGTRTDTASLVVVIPEDTVDGLVQAGYTDMGAGIDGDIANLYLDSDGTTLYAAIDWGAFDPTAGNIFFMVDNTALNNGYVGFTSWDIDDTTTPHTTNTIGDVDDGVLHQMGTGWNNLNTGNTANIEFDYIKWGNATATWDWGSASYYDATTNAQTASVTDGQAANGTVYEIGIPYADLGTGASTGDAVAVYIIWTTGQDAEELWADNATDKTDIDVASTTYTLE